MLAGLPVSAGGQFGKTTTTIIQSKVIVKGQGQAQSAINPDQAGLQVNSSSPSSSPIKLSQVSFKL